MLNDYAYNAQKYAGIRMYIRMLLKSIIESDICTNLYSMHTLHT